jgi:hypothetical protein
LQPGQVPAKPFGHLRGGLEEVGRVLGVQPGDERFQPGGHVGLDLEWRPGGFVAYPPEHPLRARGAERLTPGTQPVQQAAEAEQVGAVVHGVAAGLLGRHVSGRADDEAALGQAGVIGCAGQAEVGDLDPPGAVLQQDVGRLDVAVDQALFVGGGQADGDLQADAHDFPDLQWPALAEPILQ